MHILYVCPPRFSRSAHFLRERSSHSVESPLPLFILDDPGLSMANSNKFKSDDVPALPPPPLPEVAGVEEDFSTSLERLRNEVQQAKAITEESARETALLSALKNCRKCLEDAEEAKVIATRRVTAAKEVYENAAQALSGYTPLNSRVAGIGNSSNKRAKIDKMPRVSVAQLA